MGNEVTNYVKEHISVFQRNMFTLQEYKTWYNMNQFYIFLRAKEKQEIFRVMTMYISFFFCEWIQSVLSSVFTWHVQQMRLPTIKRRTCRKFRHSFWFNESWMRIGTDLWFKTFHAFTQVDYFKVDCVQRLFVRRQSPDLKMRYYYY